MLAIEPSRPGHHRVAIATHNRWSRATTTTAATTTRRSSSVSLLMGNGEAIQIVSSRVPLSINASSDEIEFHIQELGGLVTGVSITG